MKKLFPYLYKNPVKIKLLLSYVIIGTILLLVFAYTVFYQLKSASIDEFDSLSNSVLNQYYKLMDIQLDNTYFYFNEMYSKDMVSVQALFNESFDSLESYNIHKRLNEAIFANPIVHSVYIYNTRANLVFSNITYEYGIEDFFDRDIVNILKKEKVQETPGRKCIPRKIKNNAFDETQNTKVITMVFTDQRRMGNVQDAVVVNIDSKLFQKMINRDEVYSDSQIIVVDNDGTQLTNTNQSIDNNMYEDLISGILQQKNVRGFFASDIGGSKYFISYLKDSKWGLNLILLSKHDDLYEKINNIGRFMTFLIIVFVGIAIGIAFWLTKVMYTPLGKIIRQIKSMRSDLKSEIALNEYGFIEKSFGSLYSDIKKMEVSLDQSKTIQRNTYLKQILYGEIKEDEGVKEKIEEIFDVNPESYSIVCTFSIDSFSNSGQKILDEDIELFKFVISNVGEELLNLNYNTFSMPGEANQVIFLLGFEIYDETTIENIITTIKTIQFNINKYFLFTITASLGNVVTDLLDVHESFKSSYYAINYKLVYGYSSIIVYDELMKINRPDYSYPAHVEKKLMNALKMADIDLVEKCLDEFVSIIEQFEFEEILLAFTQLSVELVQASRSISEIQEANLNFKFIHEQIQNLETITQIKEMFMKVCTTLVLNADTMKDQVRKKYVNTIEEYINANYSRADMSIENLEEVLNLSANYIRSVFKQYKKMSVLQYLTEVRMNKAKELLRKTDYTASKISSMVGYSHNTYFSTAFKKHTGKTPEQFRKENELE